MKYIYELTQEQIDKLTPYINKWEKIGLSTEDCIDREKASQAIHKFYSCLNLEKPEYIVFTESPIHNIVLYLLLTSIHYADLEGANFREIILNLIEPAIIDSIIESLDSSRCQVLYFCVSNLILSKKRREGFFVDKTPENLSLVENIPQHISNRIDKFTASFYDLVKRSFKDFCIATNNNLETLSRFEINQNIVRNTIQQFIRTHPLEISKSYDHYKKSYDHMLTSCKGNHDAYSMAFWEYLREVLKIDVKINILDGFLDTTRYCGWFIPLNQICIVSQKPKYINLNKDTNGRMLLHSEGKPGIYYCEDFQIWLYDGVFLNKPQYYCHPNNWKSKWLLKEANAEVRRVLIQALGSDRILSELEAILLDTFESSIQGKYELYKIPEKIDVEDYLILKMTCPSTGLAHAHRVPPDIANARDAIRWVNHDIDPEKFLDVG